MYFVISNAQPIKMISVSLATFIEALYNKNTSVCGRDPDRSVDLCGRKLQGCTSQTSLFKTDHHSEMVFFFSWFFFVPMKKRYSILSTLFFFLILSVSVMGCALCWFFIFFCPSFITQT